MISFRNKSQSAANTTVGTFYTPEMGVPFFADVDYRAPRGLDRTLLQELVDGEWIMLGPREAPALPQTVQSNHNRPEQLLGLTIRVLLDQCAIEAQRSAQLGDGAWDAVDNSVIRFLAAVILPTDAKHSVDLSAVSHAFPEIESRWDHLRRSYSAAVFRP